MHVRWLLTLFPVLLISLVCDVPSAVPADEPLNVLFIAADDLNTTLGCYGDQQVQSPHIDRLASEGLLFERAYCQQAVCNPSRASLLSGRRPDTIRVYNLRADFRTAVPDAVALPQHFRQNGYHTQAIGKIYHNMGDLDDEPSWSVPSQLHAVAMRTITRCRNTRGKASRRPSRVPMLPTTCTVMVRSPIWRCRRSPTCRTSRSFWRLDTGVRICRFWRQNATGTGTIPPS